ncbi:MAG: DUF2207 domain-containing protein [Ferruginibacter sp.]
MRNSIIIVLLIFSGFSAQAQKAKTPSYYFTLTSEYYLTDAEVDSMFFEEATYFLKEHNIPDGVADKTYPVIRNMLQSMSRQGISRSFAALEKVEKIRPTVNKNADQYNQIKKLYIDAFQAEIRKTFFSNKPLSKYLSLNNSDRITYFHSIVRVCTDGKLQVQENITIHNGNGQTNPVYGQDGEEAGAVNNEIKRGIVRAFPLYYVNRYKLFQNTTFKLKEILRDGAQENYHTEKYENGILVYTGNRDIFLNEGTYRYSISYETDHQLKMLKDFDELYWNVTGNGWSFRIDSAMCTVILPKGATLLSGKSYSGLQGAADENCSMTSSTFGDSVVIVFKTTKALLPNQGITIAASWQKGIVSEPSAGQKLLYYIWNNKAVFFLPIAALFSAIFCFIFWFRYGRDPEKGTIYPLFEPPAGFSPAALGYISNQKFTQQLVAATIVDAAVRNKIKIDVERDGLLFKHNEYIISKSKLPAKQPHSRYEEFGTYLNNLVGSRIEKGKYNSSLASLNTAVKDYCEKNYKNKDGSAKNSRKGFFALNNKYTVLPVLICLAAAGWGFFDGIIKAFQLLNFWQLAYFIAGIVLCVIVLKVFSKLLRAYSPEGQQLVDKIEGFRMFLSTADEKRFDMMSPPKRSLELYEKYLPFAIALNCEIEWGKKFEDIISTAIVGGAVASSFTQSFTHDNNNFSSSFSSSFSGAISSASTPPSSSSGGGSSFSGGSSGGGGGGGGGGGW